MGAWDIFDLLSLMATIVIAVAASAIAWNANALSHNANILSEEATRLEADKQLLDWARRVLAVFSSLTSLRQRKDSRIDAETFDEQRRELRALMFALKDEGALYFPSPNGGGEVAALLAIGQTIELLGGANFRPPVPDDYRSVRVPQVEQLQDLRLAFLDDIKPRIDHHWIEQPPVKSLRRLR